MLQIFLLVISFGLFFGVVFLPVVLSIVGPKPHLSTNPSKTQRNGGTEMKSFLPNGDNDVEKDIENRSKEKEHLNGTNGTN